MGGNTLSVGEAAWSRNAGVKTPPVLLATWEARVDRNRKVNRLSYCRRKIRQYTEELERLEADLELLAWRPKYRRVTPKVTPPKREALGWRSWKKGAQ